MMITFRANRNIDKGAGYDRISESTSIGVAATSNSEWIHKFQSRLHDLKSIYNGCRTNAAGEASFI